MTCADIAVKAETTPTLVSSEVAYMLGRLSRRMEAEEFDSVISVIIVCWSLITYPASSAFPLSALSLEKRRGAKYSKAETRHRDLIRNTAPSVYERTNSPSPTANRCPSLAKYLSYFLCTVVPPTFNDRSNF
jgi:hypothetical protein